jgi:hypothetical protein
MQTKVGNVTPLLTVSALLVARSTPQRGQACGGTFFSSPTASVRGHILTLADPCPALPRELPQLRPLTEWPHTCCLSPTTPLLLSCLNI